MALKPLKKMVDYHYIKRGNKLYGPYYYRSYRVGKKVKKKYLGKNYPKKIRAKKRLKSLFYFIVLLALIASSFYLIPYFASITSKATAEPGSTTLEKNESSQALAENLTKEIIDSISSSNPQVNLSEVANITLNETATEENKSNISEINTTYPLVEQPKVNISNVTNTTEQPTETNRTGITETLVQHKAVIGKPVKWTKRIILESPSNITVELPQEASNITIKKIENESSEIILVDSLGITGQVTSSINLTGRKKELTYFDLIKYLFRKIRAKITGHAIEETVYEIETKEVNKTVEIRERVAEVEIEFYTEPPEAIEKIISQGKKEITITGPDVLHYTDILAYTYLPAEAKNSNSISLYWLNGREKKKTGFDAYDTDNNGRIDYIEWTVPSLSNQTYEVLITVINIQSYPSLGGNWTVFINTTGEADLRITAINGTTWNYNNDSCGAETCELRFENMTCGSSLLTPTWLENSQDGGNNSVFYSNYSCKQEGSETSIVLRAAKHTLKFEFGSDVAYAYNQIGITGCTNITSSGSYQLTAAITNWGAPAREVCINISVSDVEIDCIGNNNWIDGQDTDDTIGIEAHGTSTSKLTNTTIKNCNFTNWGGGASTDSGRAVSFYYVENSTLDNLTVTNNGDIGIKFYKSNYSVITNTTSSNNYEGLWLYSSSKNSIININTSNNDDEGLDMDSSFYNNFTNVTAIKNGHNNIEISLSDKNQLFNSTLKDATAGVGIRIYYSSFNNITGTRIENNSVSGYAGIQIESHASTATSNSSYNRFWNNIINNTVISGGKNWNTTGINYTNYFNTTKTSGTNIIGGSWIAGNWWSDYTGTDADGDGIGDTAYVINGSLMNDSLPLVYTEITKPSVNLNAPQNYYNTSSSTITFNCTGYDNLNLSNVSLYGNWSGVWHRAATNASAKNATDNIFSLDLVTQYYELGTNIPGAIGGLAPQGIATNGSDFWITDYYTNMVYHTNKTGWNITDGFSVVSAGGSEPEGIVFNGSDFWIVDDNDNFVYHLDRYGNNLTDGFKTSTAGSSSPFAMTSNVTDGAVTDLWIGDYSDNFVYHFSVTGSNNSDGFSTTAIGLTGMRGITTNGSDFWITDVNDNFVYHVDKIGNNITDGFSVTQVGASSFKILRGIVTNTTNGVPTDFWFQDDATNWVYHVNRTGSSLDNGFSTYGFIGNGFPTTNFNSYNLPNGITTNGTDFWIANYNGGFIYHANSTGSNISDGFSVTSIGLANPDGITTNGSDFWIVSDADDFVYHVNRTGGNMSDGFKTSVFGASTPLGITANTTNGIPTDFWIVDSGDDFVYHVNRTGSNMTNGFSTSAVGSANPYGIATNNSDFWIDDTSDLFVYHVNRTGSNMSDGFSTAPLGASMSLRGIVTNTTNDVPRYFWLVENGREYVYKIQSDNEGQFIWNCLAYDTASNFNWSDQGNWTFTVDQTAPNVTLMAPNNGSSESANQFANIDFIYNATDALTGIVNCSLYLNGTLNNTNTTINLGKNNSIRADGLAVGAYNWTVRCTNFASNLNSSGNFTYTITQADVTKPTVTLRQPVNYYNTSSSGNITFNCSATDNIAVSNVSLYGNWSGVWHSFASNGTSNSWQSGNDYLWNVTLANDWQNQSDGFNTTSALGSDDQYAITGNGSDLWITDPTDDFIYHTNKSGYNFSDGFNSNTASGASAPKGLTTNGSDFWIVDATDLFIYHAKPNGAGGATNFSDGFSTNALGSDYPRSITTNGSDFWIIDPTDDFIYHVNKSGYNFSDGFSIASAGATDVRGIETNNSDFWLADQADNFVYHVKPDGAGGSTNFSDGFKTDAFGFDEPQGITTNALPGTLGIITEFYFIDYSDHFVAHLKSSNEGQFIWNCLAYDSASNSNWSNQGNWTFTVDKTAPNVTLLDPPNLNSTTQTTVTFTYNVSDQSDIANCSFIANSTTMQTDTTVTKNTNQSISQDLYVEVFNWTINCTDAANNQYQPATRTLNITQANQAPTISGIAISPATAYTNSTLNCSGNYSDADSDKGNVSIAWYNGSAGTTYFSSYNIFNVQNGSAISFELRTFMNGMAENMSDGFLLTDGSSVSGITTNGTDFWIVDNDNNFVYHTNRTGGNMTDGFSTATFGSDSSGGITTNGSDFWVTDNTDDFVYHLNRSGGNMSDGFKINGFGSATALDITTNGSDFWITDQNDDFVYHTNKSGYNFSDGFNINASVFASWPSAITTNGSDFWIADTTDSFVYHFNRTGGNMSDGFSNSGFTTGWNYGITTYNVLGYDNSKWGVPIDFWLADYSNSFIYHIKGQSGIQAKGETWNCTMNATDAQGNAGAPNSTTRTISNFVPQLVISYPSNASSFTNITVSLNSTVLDADNDNMDVWIYAANDTRYLNTSLVYVNSSVKNAQEIIYNLTALPIQPDANTTLLLHFDNRSEFGENDTTVYDFSIGKNNGTVVGANWNMTGGKFGGAFGFNGSTDYINVSDSNSLDLTKFTVTTWVYVKTAKNYNAIVVKGADGRENFEILLYNDGHVHAPIYWTDTTRSFLDGNVGKVPADGKWHHIALTYDGTTRTLYVDGGYDNSDAPSKTPATNAKELLIGTEVGTSNRYFAGEIDEVAIWNRSLSATEILNLYRLQAQKYYWKVNATDGTTENSSFNYEFTINNSVPTTPDIGGPENASRTIGNSRTLRCANSTDADGDTINYEFWNGTFDMSSSNILQNSTTTTYTLTTTDGQQYWWRCRTNDNASASGWTVIKTFTENSVPSAVNLIYPAQGSSTTNRTPQLNWSASSDAESDSITYQVNVTCYPSCSGDNRLFNNSASNQNWTNVSSRLLYFWDDLYYYNWTVRAWDGYEFGAWNSTPFTLKLSSLISLSMLNATVNFSNLLIGQTENTTTDNPFPLSIQNDGNSFVSINMSNDTALIWSTQQSPSSYYQYKIDNVTGENISFNWSGSITTWTNVPIANVTPITFFNYTDASDSAKIDILVTVPPAEPPGAKSSRLVFTGWYVRET